MTNDNITNTQYVWAYSGSNWMKNVSLLRQLAKDDYPWRFGKMPEMFKNVLITPVVHDPGMEEIIDQLNYLRGIGHHRFLMYDSGGYQVSMKRMELNPLIEKNLYLYSTYDVADAYVLPDSPLVKGMTEEEMVAEIGLTIDATNKLYDRLPDRIQEKCMPVYQVARKSHVDMQIESHSRISDRSGMVCYSIPGSKRLTLEHMMWLKYLKSLQPDVKIHLLGTTSPLAFFPMQHIGVDSCDSITPVVLGGNGEVASYIRQYTFSHRKDDSEDLEFLRDKIKESGHRCPFCDDGNLKKLKFSFNERIIHNMLVFAEMSEYYQSLTFDEYSALSVESAEWAKLLSTALDPDIEVPEYRHNKEEPKPKKASKPVDNEPEQLTLF